MKTAAAEFLAAEIVRTGPIPFSRFMEVALYYPEFGYYRSARDPFGRGGDYYTAEQIQPAFGLLMRRLIGQLWDEAGRPADWSVVELGPGRGEMAEFFADFAYLPVDLGANLPERTRGIVFANEFFDALPVDVAVRRGAGFQEMRVGCTGDCFCWVESGPVQGEQLAYLEHYGQSVADDCLVEVNLHALRWMDLIGEFLAGGHLLIIDYGYSSRELIRFPGGTLMSYVRHRALEDVLADPGERDISAHVCFTALEDRARRCGFGGARSESLGRLLLRIGEHDEFAFLMAGASAAERQRRVLQLKSLVFGMGEVFRALLLSKQDSQKNESDPGVRGRSSNDG